MSKGPPASWPARWPPSSPSPAGPARSTPVPVPAAPSHDRVAFYRPGSVELHGIKEGGSGEDGYQLFGPGQQVGVADRFAADAGGHRAGYGHLVGDRLVDRIG